MNKTLPFNFFCLKRFKAAVLLSLLVMALIDAPLRSKAQTTIAVGPQTTTFSSWVRGYYFTAPTSFTICGLYIPTDASTDPQYVEVVRFTNGAPPAYSAVTNSFVSLFYQSNWVPNTTIPCNITVNAGDIIGVYGARGTAQINSYSTPNYVTNILGNSTTLIRSGMQFSLATSQMHDIWSEAAFQINRVIMTINCCNAATPTATPTVTYCQYDTPQPLYATGTNLQWYTVPTGGTASTTAPTPSTLTPGTTTYYVSSLGTNPAGCESPRVPIQVVVNAKPPLPVGPTVYNFCQNDPVIPLTVNGQNKKWYTTATGGTGSTTAPAYSTATPGSATWYVSQTINGCESDRLAITVNVGVKPPPPVVQTPIYYCTNDPSAPLTAVAQYQLLWYATPTGGVGSTTPPTPSTAYVDTLTYWVAQSNNGCESIRTRVQVYVNFRPNGIILSSRDQICQFDTVTFNYFGNATSSMQYDWLLPFPASTIVSGAGQGPLVVRFDSSGTYNVRMRVVNAGCPSPEASYRVKVTPAPVVRTTIQPEACVNQTVVLGLTYSSVGLDQYNWNFGGGTVQYGTYPGGPFGLAWSTPGKKVVTLQAFADGCKTKPAVDTITVHPLPDASIQTTTSADICTGDSVKVSSVETDSGYTYSWTPQLFFGDLANTGPVSYASVNATGYLGLKVTNPWGCAASDSILINTRPCCEVYFPSAFTPNGDGKNDLFRVVTQGNHKISNFRVMNRWGQTVFETNNEMVGWDGTSGGVAQPMGTYYYYIKYSCSDGQKLEQKGELLLLR
jgi:gliding motility-associated-like protein